MTQNSTYGVPVVVPPSPIRESSTDYPMTDIGQQLSLIRYQCSSKSACLIERSAIEWYVCPPYVPQ
jgi:hypothetical protein